jgi:Ribosomal protein L11, RNA binding domain
VISPRVVCPPATGWRRRSRLLVCGDARSCCALTPCAFGPMKQVKNIAHSGNLSLNDVIAVARIMRPRSMARELKGTVKEILGTCQSVGCTIDGCSAPDMLSKVSAPTPLSRPALLLAESPAALRAAQPFPRATYVSLSTPSVGSVAALCSSALRLTAPALLAQVDEGEVVIPDK